ncbi:MAG: tRNA uridine-5-carboxymethylaminomethyl(34) synthesis GTPase MnmE [Desulfamplus sp.]|nr:tRNA uridine-5-carboxymethylaminomethyl(34) synthesis GTPase MnmE [Desulfamplus sp.]
MTDTIAAIATPPGAGGIGIIRISGSRAVEVASYIFRKTPLIFDKNNQIYSNNIRVKDLSSPSFFQSHKVVHGYIVDASSNSVFDEVLLIPMLAPRSYTAEDVVEIHAHSGPIVMQTILELILSKDVRLAEPGEFTKRAFLNGRIDLTQAEAVADIINARSAVSLKIAISQGLGNLKTTIIEARETLIDLLAQIEVAIDFPEEISHLAEDEISYQNQGENYPPDAKYNNPEYDNQNSQSIVIRQVLDMCNSAIQRYQDAHFLKDGLKIAICGSPNVGKSSLMNRLLEKERSIVTEFPGTTRDLIEESLNINGIPFIISDTAGMHETDDPVEQIGISKARESITASDMVLFMEDISSINCDFSNPDLICLSDSLNPIIKKMEAVIPADKKVVVVLNKIDKLTQHEIDFIHSEISKSEICVAAISAKCNIGIDNLRKNISRLGMSNLFTDSGNGDSLSSVVPNLRHKTALQTAASSLNQALENMSFGSIVEETLAIDIRNAIDCLGEITGDSAGFDILDNIFSQFCIGK